MYNKKIISTVLGILLAGQSLVWAGTTTTAALPWTLQDSIQFALQHNEQIHAAGSGAAAAKWNVEKAKGAQNVSIQASHSSLEIGGQYWSVFHVDDVPSGYHINNISASIPVYTGGRLENGVRQAKLGAEISNLQLSGTQQDVTFQTIQSYYGILAARHFLEVRTEAIHQLTEHLKNVQTQFDIGTVTKADVLRSEVELANAKQALTGAQNRLQKSIAHFNKVIGLPILQESEMADSLVYEKNEYKLQECIAYALQHRTDAESVRKQVKQAEIGIEMAQAGKKPVVELIAGYSTYDTTIDRFGTKQWQAGVVTSMNLFDGNVTRASTKVAEQQLEQAKSLAMDLDKGVELSVQAAYLDMKQAESNIATMETAVSKAKEDFALAQARYSVNLGTNLDVVDAQVAFTGARTGYIQALYDYHVSKAALEKAMGKI